MKAIAKKDITGMDLFIPIQPESGSGIFYKKDYKYEFQNSGDIFFVYFENNMSHMFNKEHFDNFFITNAQLRNNKIDKLLK